MTGLAVALVGASGAGKSTWCARNYRPAEIVNRDALRELVADDVNDQDATADAVALMDVLVPARLRRGLTAVLDTTGCREDRHLAAAVGHQHAAELLLIVFDVPAEVCVARQAGRPGPLPGRRWGRAVPELEIRAQSTNARVVISSVDRLQAGYDADCVACPDVAAFHMAVIVGSDGQTARTVRLPGDPTYA